MSRIRSIKPSFFDHDELCALSPWHRLCFAGLWCHADKKGRMKDRPRYLKARIFPYDDLDMELLLSDLAREGFIVRYEVDGRNYLAIPEQSWKDHQRPRKDEHESQLPSIDTGIVRQTWLTSDAPALPSDEHVTTESVGSREVGNRGNGSRSTYEGVGQKPPTPSAREALTAGKRKSPKTERTPEAIADGSDLHDFLRRFVERYAQYRDGARYLVKPARDVPLLRPLLTLACVTVTADLGNRNAANWM